MQYSSAELKHFQIFFNKYQCIDCATCQIEAALALNYLKKYFSIKDLTELENSRMRAKALASTHGLVILMLAILRALNVPDSILVKPKESSWQKVTKIFRGP